MGNSTLMLPCSHKEADSRMCLRVKDAMEEGARKILDERGHRHHSHNTGIFFRFVNAYLDLLLSFLHSNRALYQASIWAASLSEVLSMPLLQGYGWKKSDKEVKQLACKLVYYYENTYYIIV